MDSTRQSLIDEINKRVRDKILEQTNADLLIKLITNADSLDEAINIAALGTTYKRTGLHFDKRLEKMGDEIRYFKKNEKLSFRTDDAKPVNKLIIGDNYQALQNLLIQYRGKIDVIYIDPPYGKDSMGEFAKTNYNNAITRDNLLSMLYPRLVLARQLLSDEGVIFCSIDDKNQAYVKCLFDEIFGEENFVGNFIWEKTKNPNSTANNIGVKHEFIISYGKNSEFVSNYVDYTEDELKEYRFADNYLQSRGKYKLVGLNKTGTINDVRENLQYDIIAPDGSTIRPNPRWRWSKEKLEKSIQENRVVFSKNKNKWSVYYKQYLNEDTNGNKIERGKFVSTIINIGTTTEGTSDLSKVMGKGTFDFPKPIRLLSHFINIQANPNSTILDFFAGSGTTGHAVLDLNKSDGGNRTFILCQLNEKTDANPNGIAYDVTSKRLKRIMTGECYDGSKDFPWIKDNEPYGGNLDVYEIEEVLNSESTEDKTPFDVIDETLYGKEKFQTVKEKIEWVCQNFDKTQSRIPEEEK